MPSLHSFDLLYSSGHVIVSFWIVELLRIWWGICCIACRGVVLGIRSVADVLWTGLVFFRRRYDSKNRTNGI